MSACAWCRGPIPAAARRDAVTCSQRCRQARHRFIRGVGVAPGSRATTPLRLAYADPPYPGLAGYYLDHPDYAGEVDHAELIRRLCSFDGWALSTSAASLQAVLALCPPGVRIASWHRGARPTRSHGPLNAWEPVIYHGGRLHADLSPVEVRHVAPHRGDGSVTVATHDASTWSTRRLDTLVYTSRPRLTDPDRVIGAKPATFAGWMFSLLGALPIDSLDDLYPGSGGISRAWATYTAAALAEAADPH